jgi:hypothetical protein
MGMKISNADLKGRLSFLLATSITFLLYKFTEGQIAPQFKKCFATVFALG